MREKIVFRKESHVLLEKLSKIDNWMTEIKKLKDEIILLERIIDENSLLSEDFLINNISLACGDISPKY